MRAMRKPTTTDISAPWKHTQAKTKDKSSQPILWMALVVFVLVSSPAFARGFQFERQDPCQSLTEKGPKDRWALLEYRMGSAGQPTDGLEVPFSSDRSFADQLRQCVDLGRTPLPGDSGTAYKVFRFAPSRHQRDLDSHRELHFAVPKRLQHDLSVPSFQGHVGFKVEMNEFGMIRQKEVLFTSEEWLGDLLLDHLDDGLKVIHRGQEEGPYTAILYLRFEDGMLTTFSQKHFVKQPQRAGL